MNLVVFLANKIKNFQKGTFSTTVFKVGIASIAIGVAVILISFAVLLGFKNTIKNKLFQMSGHIQMSKITLNQSFEEAPFVLNSELRSNLEKNRQVEAWNHVIMKSAILKSESEINGIVLKGIDENYNWRKMEVNLSQGRFISYDSSSYAKEIIISEIQAKELNLALNDDLFVYFVQSPPRVRKLKIVGIYSTGVPELDGTFSLVDIDLIRRINGWKPNEIGHLELFIEDFSNIDAVTKDIYNTLPNELILSPITSLLPQFFDWFNLLDRNIWIIIILITAVAGFNMISVLLIMIMERTPMVGLLKSLGASNQTIGRIFQYNSFRMILYGLLIGNIITICFCTIQYYFKLIPLDADNYYMEYMPIYWDWAIFILVNMGTILIVGLFTILPSVSIQRISPINALKYKD